LPYWPEGHADLPTGFPASVQLHPKGVVMMPNHFTVLKYDQVVARCLVFKNPEKLEHHDGVLDSTLNFFCRYQWDSEKQQYRPADRRLGRAGGRDMAYGDNYVLRMQAALRIKQAVHSRLTPSKPLEAHVRLPHFCRPSWQILIGLPYGWMPGISSIALLVDRQTSGNGVGTILNLFGAS
jgi:hypothetical protein